MSRRRLATTAALATAVVIGCAGGSPPTSDVPASSPATAGPSPTIDSTTPIPTATPAPTPSPRDAPPYATLSVDGGDPVRGVLGSYVWRETGTDSPWVAGSPISVGAGEPLTLELDPAIGIGTWRARYVPADQTDGTGARSLGDGTGVPSFPAPLVGRWTVEVQVDLPSGPGSASYFWLLDVT